MKTLPAEPGAAAARQPGWGMTLLLISWAVMFAPTFYRLTSYGWDSADYSHAWFVLPAFLVLLWRKRAFLRFNESEFWHRRQCAGTREQFESGRFEFGPRGLNSNLAPAPMRRHQRAIGIRTIPILAPSPMRWHQRAIEIRTIPILAPSPMRWYQRAIGIRTIPILAGWSCFLFGLGCYIFSAANRFMFLEAFSFCLVTWGLFLTKLTRASVKELAFPLAFLLFLVPPPVLAIDMATMPLKMISMSGAHALLNLARIPAESFGAVLQVGTHQMFIADACSGFRSMVTLLALGSVYLHLQPIAARRKLFLFLAIIPIGICSNIIRLFVTGAIAWNFGHERAEGFFHSFSGGLLFILATFSFIILLEVFGGRRHAKA